MTPDPCLYCGNPLDQSKEHLVLSAIGGRKTSRQILCASCNNAFGSTIDRVLAEQLRTISNQLAIVTGRGDVAPTLRGVELATGERINLGPGGKPLPLRVEPIEQRKDGKLLLGVRVPADKKHLIPQIMDGLLARHGKSEADVTQVRAAWEKTYVEAPVTLEMALGGEDAFRAIAKMSLGLLAATVRTPHLRRAEFQPIIDFIRGASTGPPGPVNHDYVNEFPEVDALHPSGGWCHRVIVSATREVVVGYVELFGHLRFSILLAAGWSGSDVTVGYSVDPTTGEGRETQGFPASAVTQAQVLQHASSPEDLRKAMKRLLPLVAERQQELVIEEMATEVTEEAFADLGEGDEITPQHIERLLELATSRLLEFKHRVSTSIPIEDPQSLMRKPEDDEG